MKAYKYRANLLDAKTLKEEIQFRYWNMNFMRLSLKI